MKKITRSLFLFLFTLLYSFSTYSQTNIWTGATDNDWSTATNWDTGFVPIATDDITIPSGLTNYPTANVSVTFNSMTINSGATFIPNSTVTGPVTYIRNLPTTNWYLLSTPVIGQTLQDLTTNYTFATGTGTNIGVGIYDSNTASSSWIYVSAASTGTIPQGLGLSYKLAAPGDLPFTGNVLTSDITHTISLGSRTNFNLVGNPYVAYINSAAFATTNTALLTEETVWLWNGTSYVTYNAASPIEIAPVQAYFVEASTSGSLSYQTTNRSHQSSDTFMRQTPKSNFELSIANNDTTSSTKVFYIEGKTTDFDNGYDSKMFGDATTEFAVYTELLTNNTGKKLAIQTLPKDNFETMIVPVGIIAKAGQEITFSVESLNLPDNINVFLEDRINGEFVNLSESTYKTTIASASNGVGQFYVHTTSEKLSTDDFIKNLANISIYKSAKQELTLTGLQANAKLTLFSLVGKKAFTTDVISNGVSKVTLPSLSDGVYIVKLTSEFGEVNKKILVD